MKFQNASSAKSRRFNVIMLNLIWIQTLHYIYNDGGQMFKTLTNTNALRFFKSNTIQNYLY